MSVVFAPAPAPDAPALAVRVATEDDCDEAYRLLLTEIYDKKWGSSGNLSAAAVVLVDDKMASAADWPAVCPGCHEWDVCTDYCESCGGCECPYKHGCMYCGAGCQDVCALHGVCECDCGCDEE